LRRRIIYVKNLEALRRRSGHADKDMTQAP